MSEFVVNPNPHEDGIIPVGEDEVVDLFPEDGGKEAEPVGEAEVGYVGEEPIVIDDPIPEEEEK